MMMAKGHHYVDVPPPGPYEIWALPNPRGGLPRMIDVRLPDGTTIRETLVDYEQLDDGNLRLWFAARPSVEPTRPADFAIPEKPPRRKVSMPPRSTDEPPSDKPDTERDRAPRP